MFNVFDPDQAHYFVVPSLGLNCLKNLSEGEILTKEIAIFFIKSLSASKMFLQESVVSFVSVINSFSRSLSVSLTCP